MRDFSLLDSAIDEMERVLLGNKPREAEEIYLQNAIDFIERFIKQLIEESKLNENQQIVLDWLKEKYTVTNIEPIELFWRLRVNSIKPDYRGRPVYRSYRYMSKTGQLQVLQTFSQWALEEVNNG